MVSPRAARLALTFFFLLFFFAYTLVFVLFFGEVVRFGGARFPPGAWETLPGTSSGAGLVNGPWQASAEHGCCCAPADGKPPPSRAS